MSEGFLCSNTTQPLLGQVKGAAGGGGPGGTGEGRRCWRPLGPGAEVSTGEEKCVGAEMSGQWPGRAGAEECP